VAVGFRFEAELQGTRLALNGADVVFVTRDVPFTLRDELRTRVRHIT
jgi:hypothetical protein